MKVADGYEVLELVVVQMDPVVEGFAGVLIELVFDGERHVVIETALGSGDRLMRFCSCNPKTAYALLRSEIPGAAA